MNHSTASRIHDLLLQGITGLARENPLFGDADAIERWVDALATYVDDLRRSNPVFGLIAAEDVTDDQTLVARHILDSIAGAPEVAAALKATGGGIVFDLGSGAGLPGIPLAVVLGDRIDRCALVERRERRVRFLYAAVARLAVPGLQVVHADAVRPAASVAEQFRCDPPPVVVFRAYQQTTAETLAGLTRRFPRRTRVIAWKGRRAAAEADAAVIESAPGVRLEHPGIVPVVVPFLDRERCLLRYIIE